jgi:hypothetical protein
MGEFVIEAYERYRAQHTTVRHWWVLLLINTDNGEHTDIEITDEPHSRLEALTKAEGSKHWVVAALVNVGTHEQAQQFAKQITGDKHQIRGIMSRTAMMSLLAEKHKFPGYADMDVVFKLPGAEQHLERV